MTDDKKHRAHLPMPNTQRSQYIAYDARDPDSKFPLIEQLRPPAGAPNVLLVLIDDAGFGSASAFGGPCQTPAAEGLASGGGGFEYFHGFIGGEANQWYPTLYEGTTPVEPSKAPEQGYHLVEDMTDKAVAWIAQQKALTPDQPFFVYFAPGAAHAPHHVPKEWADKYKGQFDQGWDRLREEKFARQKQLGVIPPDSELTARHAEIPAWDAMSDDIKPVLRRQMEVYAGFMEYTDHHVGRIFDMLKKLGIRDDTLIYYIIGDNGASAEGTLNGACNEMANFNGLAGLETPGIPDATAGQAGRAGILQPLRRRLGACDEHALSMDQAGRLALGRHPQRHHCIMAKGDRGQGRDPVAIHPCHRHCPHHP